MNLGIGIIQTDFNLYILSLGISPEFLGIVLSLTPLAQAFSAIPIGFLAEKIGNRKAFILVNLIVSLSYFLRAVTPNRVMILFGSFLLGTVQAGYFIIKMPFISHYSGVNKDHEFTYSNIVFFSSLVIGNLIGGYLPTLLDAFFFDETLAYRVILLAATVLVLSATIPLYLLEKDDPADTRNISFSPYLKGMDTNTVRFAGIQFFVGTGLAFLMLFMNVVFVFYYQSDLQAFGLMSAVLVIPTILFLIIGPILTKKYNSFRIILLTRFLGGVFAIFTIITTNSFLGASAYILFRSILGLSGTLWLSFASTIATRRSRTATSAWLEITFQIGFVFASILGGQLIAREYYPALGVISGLSCFTVAVLMFLFFGKKYYSFPPMPSKK
jgi:MFS family permease